MYLKKFVGLVQRIHKDVKSDPGKTLEISKDGLLELASLYEENKEVSEQACDYYSKRELYNSDSLDDAYVIFHETTRRFLKGKVDFEYKLQKMSSYPRTNLISSGDFDLGLLVKDLNEEKLFELTLVLIANGYMPEKMTKNKFNPKSNSYRFSKMLRKCDLLIETEIKIRDLDGTRAVCRLHEHIDEKLSEEDYVYWTYHKHLLDKMGDKQLYTQFKLIMYHAYFLGLEGAFAFDYYE